MNQTTTISLPLEGLFERLQLAGFAVTAGTRLRVYELLRGELNKDLLQNPEELAGWIAPLVAKNRGQQERFHQIFQDYLRHVRRSEEEKETQKDPEPVETPDDDPFWKQPRFWAVVLAGVTALLLTLGVLYQNELPPFAPDEREVYPQDTVQKDAEAEPDPIDTTKQEPTTDDQQLTTDPEQPTTDNQQLTTNLTYKSPKTDTQQYDIRYALNAAGNWAFALVFGVVYALLLLLLYAWHRWRTFGKTPEDWHERFAFRDNPPYSLAFPTQEHRIETQPEVFALADAMRKRRESEKQVLDIAETIRYTVQNGGMPSLRYRSTQKPAEYLILRDAENNQKQYSDLFAHLIRTLAREEVYLESYHYYKDPRYCFDAQGNEIPLSELYQQFPEHDLILFGDAENLVSPRRRRFTRWSRELLTQWKRRAIVTPVGVESWGLHERLLSRLFVVLPADLPAMLQLVERLTDPESTAPSPLPATENPVSEADLRLWEAALAVADAPDWNITLRVGKALQEAGLTKQPLLSYTTLYALSRRESLQRGQWDRTERQTQLDYLRTQHPEAETTARRAVQELLRETTPPENSYAQSERNLQLTVQEAALAPDREGEQTRNRLLRAGLIEGEPPRAPFPRVAAAILLLLCGLGAFAFYQSQFPEVEKATHESYPRLTEKLDTLGIDSAIWYNNEGVTAYQAKDTTKAEANYTRALALREQDYDTARYNLNLIAYNRGVFEFNRDSFALAVKAFEEVEFDDSLKKAAADNAKLAQDLKEARAEQDSIRQKEIQDSLDSIATAQTPDTVNQTPDPGTPKPATFTETLSKTGISFKMIAVEGGTFTMGCTEEQGSDCYDNEKPAHQVRLSSFYMAETEVTVGQYLAFCRETDTHWPEWLEKGNDYHVESGSNEYYKKKGYARKGSESLPIVGVSWNDAQAYCQWLSKKTGKNYRLPTEAEWEYAARGGQKAKPTKYAGSDVIDGVAWYDENSYDLGSDHPNYGTNPVGQKAPNELGLYDMSGNVWEWCQDWYGEDYYAACKKKGTVSDPKGPDTGDYRVLRGGSWYFSPRLCRVAHRFRNTPTDTGNGGGFRVVSFQF